ncbi:MAG: tocopherol cyclase family protein [Candidatus Izimaplasma sp.]|nr:tocopherol cyclase family protein [Candidatus Izimaplasma bacterium]
MFDKIRNPIVFQGSLSKKSYFEGWYYKQVSRDKNTTIAFIPGISLNETDSHCFIQVFLKQTRNNKETLSTEYYKIPLENFETTNKPFLVRIKKQLFWKKGLKIDLKTQKFSIKGELKFSDFSLIKRTLFSPSIMGPFRYLPKMECNHAVVSMSHKIQGRLNINGNEIDFSNGKGYMEKDWGTSFPKKYVWMQANHFKNNKTSFMFSHALIPYMKLSFQGLICTLIIAEKEYRFATYNRSKIINYHIGKNHIHYLIKKKNITLELTAKTTTSKDLVSPKKGMMSDTIKEGLSGIVTLNLKVNNKLIYEDTSEQAGIEIMMLQKKQ